MSEGFQHAIAGGQGKLIISQLQSPNFQLSPLTGWAILKDGQAYFASIVLPPGTVPVITFAATAPASPHTGDLWYDTANGNQVSQWNGSAWVAYQYGTAAIGTGAITASQIAANTITASQLAAGIVYAGIVDSTTIEGATLVAGTAPNAQVIIEAIGNAGLITFPTNDATEAAASSVLSEVIGSGAGKILEVVLGGPVSTGAADQSLIFLQSNTAGGSSTAFGILAYKDTSGVTHTVAYWDSAGLHVIETLYGSSGTVTVGDAVQVNNNMTVTGTLSVNGSTDTGVPTNNDTSTTGLPNGGIQGTSGSQSAGTAHTHGPGSYSVTNGMHFHTLNNHQHAL
jgi:hypothetical protein